MGSISSSIEKPTSSTRIQIQDLKDQVNKKADDTWTKDMLKIHNDKIEETKKIALSTKSQLANRGCQQEEAIKEMMKVIQGARNLKITAILSFLIIISGGLFQFFSLKNKAENNAKVVQVVQESVSKIEDDVEEVSDAVESHIEESKRTEVEKEEEKQELLKDISEVFKIEIKKSRRRN